MPWSCCQTVHPDSLEACPSCGGQKRSWTLRLGATRAFSIRRVRDDSWSLDTLDYVTEDEEVAGDSSRPAGRASRKETAAAAEDEDDEWELEQLDTLPPAEDEALPPDGSAPPAAPPARKEAAKPPEDEEDWNLDELSTCPPDEDERVGSGGGGGPEKRSTRTAAGAGEEPAAAEEDEEWELEALDTIAG